MKWLKTLKGELWFAAIVLLGFFVGVPLLLQWMYGGNMEMVSPAYVGDLFWRLVKLPVAILGLWIVVRIAFPTVEGNLSRDEEYPSTFFGDDWHSASPAHRLWITIVVIVGVFVGICVLIG